MEVMERAAPALPRGLALVWCRWTEPGGAGGKVVRRGSQSACLLPAGEALLLLLPFGRRGLGEAGWLESRGWALQPLCGGVR